MCVYLSLYIYIYREREIYTLTHMYVCAYTICGPPNPEPWAPSRATETLAGSRLWGFRLLENKRVLPVCITSFASQRAQPLESCTALPIKRICLGHPTLGEKYCAVNSCDPNWGYGGESHIFRGFETLALKLWTSLGLQTQPSGTLV